MSRVTNARRAVLAAIIATLIIAPRAGAACRAGHQIGAYPPAQARAAVRCVLNAVRRRRARAPLRWSHALQRAAIRHSLEMVRDRTFGHDVGGRSTIMSRARATGYVAPAMTWLLGENIGWTAGATTPRAMVRAWMASPPHRANILSPRFRDVGIGIAAGTPAGGAGATFTADFGRRS